MKTFGLTTLAFFAVNAVIETCFLSFWGPPRLGALDLPFLIFWREVPHLFLLNPPQIWVLLIRVVQLCSCLERSASGSSSNSFSSSSIRGSSSSLRWYNWHSWASCLHEGIIHPYRHGSSEDKGLFVFIVMKAFIGIMHFIQYSGAPWWSYPCPASSLAEKCFKIKKTLIMTFAYKHRLRITDAKEGSLASNHYWTLAVP